MSSAKITLFSMYKYMQQLGDDLFSGFSLPEGVNRETAINTILLSGGEYEVIYPDPEFMKFSINTWSDKWYHTIARWYAAISQEYDPLENYNRTEEQTRTPDLEKKRTADLTRERTADLTDERTPDLTYERTPDLLVTNAGTVTEETQRSAYDSSSYEPDEKRITTPENTIATTGTDTNTETGTETTTHTGTDTNTESGTDTITETGTEKTEIHAYGNIGTMTSQQMLGAEIQIAEWSLYDSIARLFLQEYVIPVMV